MMASPEKDNLTTDITEPPDQGKISLSDQSENTSVSDEGKKTSLGEQGEKTSLSEQQEKTSHSEQGEKISLSVQGEKTSLSEQGEKTSCSEQGEKTSLSVQGEKTSISQQGEKTSLGEQEAKTSLSEQGEKTSLSEQGEKTSLSEQGEKTSISQQGERTSLSGQEAKTSLIEQGEKTSVNEEGEKTSVNKDTSNKAQKLEETYKALGVWRCPNCFFTTDDEPLHKAHMTICSKKPKDGQILFQYSEGKYFCKSCDIFWENKTEFDEHVVCHISENPYVCMSCRKQFSSRQLIEKHTRHDHPTGDSRCGLRGIKKGRQFVEELKQTGSLTLFGKLKIPKTPRTLISKATTQSPTVATNLLKDDIANSNSSLANSDTSLGVSNTVLSFCGTNVSNTAPCAAPGNVTMAEADISGCGLTTVSSTEGKSSENTHLISPLNSQTILNTSTPELDGTPCVPTVAMSHSVSSNVFMMGNNKQSPEVSSVLASGHQKQVTGHVSKSLPFTSQTDNSVTTLFGIVNKDTGKYEPATVPNSIQKLVDPQTSQKNTASHPSKSPQYHVKHITEYTTANTIPTASTAIPVSCQQLYLIPCGPVIQTLQPNQTTSYQKVISSTLPVYNSVIPTHTIPKHQGPESIIQGKNGNKPIDKTPSNHMQQSGVAFVNAQLASPQPLNTSVQVVQQPFSILMQNQNKQLLCVKSGSTVPNASQKPLYNVPRVEGLTTLPGLESKLPSSAIPAMKSPVTIAPKPLFVPSGLQNVTSTAASVPIHTEDDKQLTTPILIRPTNQGTKFMFRIKPGNGFVCEACRKFTKDEFVFKGHIWNHFHVDQKACGNCTAESISKRQVYQCKLVNGIVCNLIKRCSYEISTVLKQSLDSNEVISISDDEDDMPKPGDLKPESGTEVVVLDEKDIGNGLQIRIDSTCTISEADYITSSLAEIVENKVQNGTKIEVDDTKNVYIESKEVSNELKENGGVSHQKDEEKIVVQLIENGDTCSQRTDVNDGKSPVLEINRSNVTGQKSEIGALLYTNDQEDTSLLTKEPSNSFYMCAYENCLFYAFTPLRYKEHLIEHHLDEYNFVCCHCGLKDYTMESHIRHMHTHASAKSFALYCCPVRLCSYKSNLLRYYICHLNAHRSEDVNLKCTYCHKLFETTEKLQNHLKANILKFVNCNYCPFKFGRKNTVLHHIRNVHKDKPRCVTVTGQIVCLEREINFYNPPTIKSLQLAEPQPEAESLNIPAIMEQLQKESGSFTDKEAMEDGIDTDKSSINEANKPIPDNDRNKEKKRSTSFGPKSMLCPHCNYLSYNASLHDRHLALHEQEPDKSKRFVCNSCPTAVDYLGAFKKHMANHLGRHEIKVYSCTSCQYSTNLKRHIMDHCEDNHDGTGLYTFVSEVVLSAETTCKYCDFTSRQADQVVLHEKLVHEPQPTVTLERYVPDNVGSSQSVSSEETPQNDLKGNMSKKYKYHCEYCCMFFKHKVQLVNHLEDEHIEIENKTFTFYKCKYCPLGSTRKELIVSHLEKNHSGKEVRILRKIEKVQSGYTSPPNSGENVDTDSLEQVVIPNGNVYKVPFNCPKCKFSTLMRISALRHLKEHPDLKPVREKSTPSLKKTARKSTTSNRLEFETKRKSTLCHGSVQGKENPFTAVKEAVEKHRESENSSNNTYNLGDTDLHSILSSCFTPIEVDAKFKCKICLQDIVKQFVLHRHVLEHLKVEFFKCQYCPEGSVEKTLLFGHIQKSHHQQPLLYHQLSKDEVNAVINKRIAELKLCDEHTTIIKPPIKSPERPCEKRKNNHSPKQYNPHSDLEKTHVDDESKKYSCSYEGCRYKAHRVTIMEFHLMYHGDKTRNFRCNQCDYRSTKAGVVKHVKRQHNGNVHVKPVKIEEPFSTSEAGSLRRGSIESLSTVRSGINEGKYLKSLKGQKIGSLTLSKDIAYEMRKVLKCKDCGEKRNSICAMYRHLELSKCKRPAYRCSFCSFQRYKKVDITRHSKIRHPGKKLEIITLPRSAKFKSLTVPIKYLNEENTERNDDNGHVHLDDKRSNTKSIHDANSSISNLVGTLDKDVDFTCGLCRRYTCDSLIKLQFHINTTHDGQILNCDTCSYRTPLIKHMINHCKHVHLQKSAKYGANTGDMAKKTRCSKTTELHNKDRYCCTMCSCERSRKSSLRVHYFKHFNYAPFICSYCSKGFSMKYYLNIHLSSVHSKKSPKFRHVMNSTIERKITQILEEMKPINLRETEQSPIKTSKKRSLENDLDTGSQVVKQSKTNSMTGQILEETFLEEGEIKSSNNSPIKYQVCLDACGNRIFMCSRCSYTSSEKRLLRLHMASHGARFFKCCYCSFSTKMKSNAYRHCKRIHSGKVPRIMDKKTSTIITVDEDVKGEPVFFQSNHFSRKIEAYRYNCYLCSETMNGLSNFKIHLNSHSEFQDRLINFDVQVAVTNCKDATQTDEASSEFGFSSNVVDSKTQCAELINQSSNPKDSKGNYCFGSSNEIKQLIDNEKGSEVGDLPGKSSIGVCVNDSMGNTGITHLAVSDGLQNLDSSPAVTDIARKNKEDKSLYNKQNPKEDTIKSCVEGCQREKQSASEETILQPLETIQMPVCPTRNASDASAPNIDERIGSVGFEVNQTSETMEIYPNSEQTRAESENVFEEEYGPLSKQLI